MEALIVTAGFFGPFAGRESQVTKPKPLHRMVAPLALPQHR